MALENKGGDRHGKKNTILDQGMEKTESRIERNGVPDV